MINKSLCAALAVIATICVMAACAERPHGTLMHDGGLAVPPAGWLDYCHRYPTDAAC